MNATLTANAAENFGSNRKAKFMTSTVCPLSIEIVRSPNSTRKKWRDVLASLWKVTVNFAQKVWAKNTNDLSYEQWNRLEYRYELAGRIGEKMNPTYLR